MPDAGPGNGGATLGTAQLLLAGWIALQVFLASGISLLRHGFDPLAQLFWLALGMASALALYRRLQRAGASGLAERFALGYCAFAGGMTGSQWQGWLELCRTTF